MNRKFRILFDTRFALLFLLFFALVSCSKNVEKSFEVWGIGDGVRVNPETGEIIENQQNFFGKVVDNGYKIKNWIWDSGQSSIALKAARNEVVSCQLVIDIRNKPLKEVYIRKTDLTGQNGATISSDNLSLFREWYHYVSESKVPRQGVRYPLNASWYPDALIPVSLEKYGMPFDIPSSDFYAVDGNGETVARLQNQTNQAIWLDMYVPDNTPPGIYKGQLEISAKDVEVQKVEVSLEVFDFNLSDDFHTTWELMDYGRVTEGSEDLELKIFQMTKQHRITLSSTGVLPDTIGQGYGVEFDWNGFDQRWGKYFDGSAFEKGPGKGKPTTHMLLPFDAKVRRYDKTKKWWGKDWPFPLIGDSTDQRFSPEYDKAFSQKLFEFENHFDENGWVNTKMLFWPEGVDEPQPDLGEVGLKSLNMAKHYGVLLEDSGTKRVKYRLDIGGGLQSSVDLDGDGEIAPDTEELINYIEEVVDVWNCSGKWIRPDQLNMRDGRERWTDVWFYNGYPPATGTMMINGESLGLRTWQWMVWKYGLSGACDWEFGLTQDKNVFRQTIVDDSEGYPYLRNMYIFPGEQIGLHGEPIPSIRLKMMRRSIQDYEYFWTLATHKTNGRELADGIVNRIMKRGLRDAVDYWPDLKDNPNNWSHRPEEWYKARLQLASHIVSETND